MMLNAVSSIRNNDYFYHTFVPRRHKIALFMSSQYTTCQKRLSNVNETLKYNEALKKPLFIYFSLVVMCCHTCRCNTLCFLPDDCMFSFTDECTLNSVSKEPLAKNIHYFYILICSTSVIICCEICCYSVLYFSFFCPCVFFSQMKVRTSKGIV